MKNWGESRPMLMSRARSSMAMVSRVESVENRPMVPKNYDSPTELRPSVEVSNVTSGRSLFPGDYDVIDVHKTKLQFLQQDYEFIFKESCEIKNSFLAMDDQLKSIMTLIEQRQMQAPSDELQLSPLPIPSNIQSQVSDFTLEQNLGEYSLGYRSDALNVKNHDSMLQSSETPMFDGKCSSVDDWIEKVEMFFSFMMCGEEMKLDLVSFCLEGEALHWFRRVIRRRRFKVWDDLKQELRDQFGCVTSSPVAVNLRHEMISSKEVIHETKLDLATSLTEQVSKKKLQQIESSCLDSVESSQLGKTMIMVQKKFSSTMEATDEKFVEEEFLMQTGGAKALVSCLERHVTEVAEGMVLKTESVLANAHENDLVQQVEPTTVAEICVSFGGDPDLSCSASDIILKNDSRSEVDHEAEVTLQKVTLPVFDLGGETESNGTLERVDNSKHELQLTTVSHLDTFGVLQPQYTERSIFRNSLAVSQMDVNETLLIVKLPEKSNKDSISVRANVDVSFMQPHVFIKLRSNFRVRKKRRLTLFPKAWRFKFKFRKLHIAPSQLSPTGIIRWCTHQSVNHERRRRVTRTSHLWHRWKNKVGILPQFLTNVKIELFTGKHERIYISHISQSPCFLGFHWEKRLITWTIRWRYKWQWRHILQELPKYAFDDGNLHLKHKWTFKQLKTISESVFGVANVVTEFCSEVFVFDKSRMSCIYHKHFNVFLEQQRVEWPAFCSKEIRDQSQVTTAFEVNFFPSDIRIPVADKCPEVQIKPVTLLAFDLYHSDTRVMARVDHNHLYWLLTWRGVTWIQFNPNDSLLTLIHVQTLREVGFVKELLAHGVTRCMLRVRSVFWDNQGFHHSKWEAAVQTTYVWLQGEGKLGLIIIKGESIAFEPTENFFIDSYKKSWRTDEQIDLLKQKLWMVYQREEFKGKSTKIARSQGKILRYVGWIYIQLKDYTVAETVYWRDQILEANANMDDVADAERQFMFAQTRQEHGQYYDLSQQVIPTKLEGKLIFFGGSIDRHQQLKWLVSSLRVIKKREKQTLGIKEKVCCYTIVKESEEEDCINIDCFHLHISCFVVFDSGRYESESYDRYEIGVATVIDMRL